MSVRKLHVEKVLDMGNKAGDTSRDLNVAAELLMYGAMWLACKLLRPEYSEYQDPRLTYGQSSCLVHSFSKRS